MSTSAVGQSFKYGYWNFGTDLLKICATDKKPAIGYSLMQEQHCHTPYDKARTDYIEKSIAGCSVSFLKLMDLPKCSFMLEQGSPSIERLGFRSGIQPGPGPPFKPDPKNVRAIL